MNKTERQRFRREALDLEDIRDEDKEYERLYNATILHIQKGTEFCDLPPDVLKFFNEIVDEISSENPKVEEGEGLE